MRFKGSRKADRQREGPMTYEQTQGVAVMERDQTMPRDGEAAADDEGRATAADVRDGHGTAMRGSGGHGV